MMGNLKQQSITVNNVRLNVWTGGEGKPIVLLHGFPQTAIMWRKITPQLLKKYTVICPDLRGYGDSQKPISGYDNRTMAKDIKALMDELSFSSYSVISHDRGARVAHRLALDFPECVEKLCVLDIVPTHTVFQETDRNLAVGYWHWYFFQLPDVPEMLLNQNPEAIFNFFMHNYSYNTAKVENEAMEEYLRTFKLPGTIRAVLEDYRAAATTDFKHDEESLNQKLTCPTLVLWGQYGKMHEIFNVLQTWEEKAEIVQGKPLPCGHFIAEEAPDELLNELIPFLAE